MSMRVVEPTEDVRAAVDRAAGELHGAQEGAALAYRLRNGCPQGNELENLLRRLQADPDAFSGCCRAIQKAIERGGDVLQRSRSEGKS